MHWSQRIAQEAIRRNPGSRPIVVGSGYTPSGEFHIGHSREFLTAAMIAKAVEQLGRKVNFISFIDDFDPLRSKRYPFLEEEYQKKWAGCPLYRIPDPWECHSSYADHFLKSVEQSFGLMKIEPQILRASQLYNWGKFSTLIQKALGSRREIAAIIREVAKKETIEEWPFSPECPKCRSISATEIIKWPPGEGLESSMAIYCHRCQKHSMLDLTHGGGKLSWRTDWPMRWKYLGVDVEPFGHDHASAGGSYETGMRIAREVFGIEPPIPAPYKWFHLKGGGAMHSSTGKNIPALSIMRSYPAEIVWWMIARREPDDLIKFDPVDSLFEEARLLRQASGSAASAYLQETFSLMGQFVDIDPAIMAYPYEHLAVAAQLGNFDPDVTLGVLQRSTSYRDSQVKVSPEILEKISSWLGTFGEKCQIRVGAYDENLTAQERDMLGALLGEFKSISQWDAETVLGTIYEVAKKAGAESGSVFKAVYKRLIGKESGPRAGWFLETLGKQKVLALL